MSIRAEWSLNEQDQWFSYYDTVVAEIAEQYDLGWHSAIEAANEQLILLGVLFRAGVHARIATDAIVMLADERCSQRDAIGLIRLLSQLGE